MREMIDTLSPVYFCDEEKHANFFLKLIKILYQDETVCLCQVQANDGEVFDDKILFKIKEHTVENEEFYHWTATNDLDYVCQHLKEQEIKNKISLR